MTKREEAIKAARKIINLMEHYDHTQWIRPIKEILDILCDVSKSDSQALLDSFQIFEYINGGYGSYSDFYIETKIPTESKMVNSELDHNNYILWNNLK